MNKQEAYENVIKNPMSAEAWQECGKACEWKKYMCVVYSCGVMYDVNGYAICPVCGHLGAKESKLLVALRFHEINLTEGWDKAVSYLTSLIGE